MRIPKAAYGIFPIMLVSSATFAQQVLTGKVRKKGGDEVLLSVSVQNKNQKKYNLSDIGGNYRIPAKKGDSIIFSSAGYKPDTTIVNGWMFAEANGYDVFLEPNLVELPTYRVGELNNYQLDSLKRKEDYAWLDNVHQVKLAGGKRFSDGVGISFSPINYFYGPEANRRKLRRRLEQEEKDYYIDYRFPRPYVARMTRLTGDSLQLFMYRYRPTYKFCRKASNEEILHYISDKLKRFRNSGK
jgi:hypothetical protein